jgi:hypothetical protein
MVPVAKHRYVLCGMGVRVPATEPNDRWDERPILGGEYGDDSGLWLERAKVARKVEPMAE